MSIMGGPLGGMPVLLVCEEGKGRQGEGERGGEGGSGIVGGERREREKKGRGRSGIAGERRKIEKGGGSGRGIYALVLTQL